MLNIYTYSFNQNQNTFNQNKNFIKATIYNLYINAIKEQTGRRTQSALRFWWIH